MAFEPRAQGVLLGGRYRIVRLIAKGGMGATYEAEDRGRQGKKVVIKELTNSFDSSLERQVGVRNFLAEVQVLASLSHPSIPRVLDHFVEGDYFFFVMELFEGIDLGSCLEERGRVGLPSAEVVRWGVAVCKVLEYIHALTPPLIHRDLKPSNLIWRHSDGKLFLIDFGIARVARPASGYMIGTLGYAPPEQHDNYVEPRSDIYALGVTLHELLTGVKPEQYKFEFVPPSLLNSSISEELSAIIMKALAYAPDDRWENAGRFREALEGLEEYISFTVQLGGAAPEADLKGVFSVTVKEYLSASLVPYLEEVRNKYLRECQTLSIPKEFLYFELVLGSITQFKLIVSVDEDAKEIIFSEQDGLLSPRALGKVNPLIKDEWGKGKTFIQTFEEHFEETNTAGGFSLLG